MAGRTIFEEHEQEIKEKKKGQNYMLRGEWISKELMKKLKMICLIR
jgi:hypothetical protein